MNWLNIDLPLQAWVEKTVHGMETHWLSSKEKVPGAAVSKESHAVSLLEHERTHPPDFLEKGTTVNSALYYNIWELDNIKIELQWRGQKKFLQPFFEW